MNAATPTLTDFLLARIAEDEATARACDPQSWWVDGDPGDTVYGVVHASWEERVATPANVAHISRHDPARVLAECEAKRRIIEFRYSWNLQAEGAPDAFKAILQAQVLTADTVLRTLATVYADHPDYDAEWAV